MESINIDLLNMIKLQIMRIYGVENEVFLDQDMNKFKQVLIFVLDKLYGYSVQVLSKLMKVNCESIKDSLLQIEWKYIECSISRAQILTVCKKVREKVVLLRP